MADEFSTTDSGSGSETDSGAEADNLRANADAYAEAKEGLDSTGASARETFKRMTQETDKKNAALARDRSTHSIDVASSSDDDSREGGRAAESKLGDGGGGGRGGGGGGGGGSSSGSGSDSDSMSAASSPKQGGDNVKTVTGQHHDEEMELEMRCDGCCPRGVLLLG
jgi:hypothetical protein